MGTPRDHYKTLNITRRANIAEIKKAFRRLAMQYHPDKMQGSSSVEKFAEVQQAYLVLSDPEKRAAYDYELYLSGPSRNRRPEPVTALEVVAEMCFLASKAAAMDPFRRDVDVLAFALKELLSASSIHTVASYSEAGMTRDFFSHLFTILEVLPVAQVRAFLGIVSPLSDNDPVLQQETLSFMRRASLAHYWNRYKILVALATAAIFCALVVFSSGRR